MKNYLLLLSVVLVGCGCDDSDTITQSEFRIYKANFLSKLSSDVQNTNTEIRFATDEEVRAKLSWSNAGCDEKRNLVIVKESFWNRLDATEKELVIYHELGHCILHKSHDTGQNADGSPLSIMYPNALALKNYYTLHHSDYLAELFE